MKEFKPYIYFQKWKSTNFVKFLVFTLHLSVALNISYSLLSAAGLQDGITKQLSTYKSYLKKLQQMELWVIESSGIQSNPFLHQNSSITMNISIVVNGNIMEDEQKLTNEFNSYYINIAKTTSGKPQEN